MPYATVFFVKVYKSFNAVSVVPENCISYANKNMAVAARF